MRDHELAVRNAETAYKSFKQSLADMLSDSVVQVESYEESIRDRVKWLTHAVRDKSAVSVSVPLSCAFSLKLMPRFLLQHIDMLECKVRDLSNQLENQCDLERTAEGKLRRVEKDFLELEERLRRAESEMAAGEALRDGFRIDKERVSSGF